MKCWSKTHQFSTHCHDEVICRCYDIFRKRENIRLITCKTVFPPWPESITEKYPEAFVRVMEKQLIEAAVTETNFCRLLHSCCNHILININRNMDWFYNACLNKRLMAGILQQHEKRAKIKPVVWRRSHFTPRKMRILPSQVLLNSTQQSIWSNQGQRALLIAWKPPLGYIAAQQLW